MIDHNAYDAYLESKILSASPIELVRILYDAGLSAIREARSCLAAGRIEARSRAISQALAILAELSCSLDHGKGGEVSRNLAELYDYMQRRLIAANHQQFDLPLVEALRLMEKLSEAWREIDCPAAETNGNGNSHAKAHAQANANAHASVFMGSSAEVYVSQSWRL